MSESNVLRQKARQAIRARKMPRRYPDRLWGGPGTGARCTVCGETVGPNDIEFEIDFPREDDRPGRDNPRVHARCFAEWEMACRDLEAAGANRPSGVGDSFAARNGAGQGSS